MNESQYILLRKIKGFVQKTCFYICRVFNIKKNLVTVCTFEGKGGFGCNPKYIIQELHKQAPEVKIVWLVNSDCIDKQLFPEYVKKVKNTMWRRAYWLSISKVWIDNYRKPYGSVKRKGQYYINTWHGTVGFKSIGLWRGESFSKMAYLVSKNDSDMIDEIITDSKWCDEIFHKGLLYEKTFMKIGYPRCDLLFGNRKEQKLYYRQKNNLSEDVKLLLYAPTFRESSQNGNRRVNSEICSIDFSRVVKRFEEKFGGSWYVVFRLHPQLANKYDEDVFGVLSDCKKVINASNDPDMYEVLSACDALITDYSSVAMEAGFMEIPVFLYADDLEEYMMARGGQQWLFSRDLSSPIINNREMMPNLDLELPFSLAQNNDELDKNILSFNDAFYSKKILKFKNDLELVFDGKASARAAKLVIDMLNR